ncbi:SGNH/GDSL hydrolase family protein [uncultured Pontibacter sp.]|uniref:SGNH/GDSL hydrolase family protein n=1 Tax=uncultured Pontibacter sp. TaxID=453356 RepID=UPI002625FD35|nr:SGNH/GDSL hydrolase family protein [uncultured Pontibacter sp.]
MKKFFYKSSMLALAAGMLLTSCDPEIDSANPSSGELNLENYVAVGNSLTAGYQDNGLYLEGQLNSYPAILAQQFAFAGGGEFKQPLFSDAQRNGSGYLRLTGFASPTSPTLTPVRENLAVVGMGQDGKTPLLAPYLEPINNLGIPGIRMADVSTPGYGFNNPMGFNPYYERILPDDVTPTGALLPYVNRVAASNPTFFTMWLGNNDVLGYATSGGIAPITPSNTFQSNLDAMVNALVGQNAAKGAIINIPDVTAVPFFTTKATAQIMQSAAAAKTKLYIIDKDNQMREAKATDYILLTSTVGTPETVGTNQIPHGFSPFNPLANSEVLDEAEVAAVKAATVDFNNKLAAAAQAKNLALVDMNTFFNSIKGGFAQNGVAYSPTFITGNLFSLDAVHLTPRGYAIVANEIIKNINSKYNASIPQVDVTQYRAVLLP